MLCSSIVKSASVMESVLIFSQWSLDTQAVKERCWRDDHQDLPCSIDNVKKETEEPNRIEFGGEVKPQALRMMGICEAVFEDGLQACVWRAEENSTDEPVTKYKISF